MRKNSSKFISKNPLFNRDVFLDCRKGENFNYDKFYNQVNYVVPGDHLKIGGYYDVCLEILKNGGKWLDVGCASGIELVKAKRDNLEVYGIDIVDESVEKSKKNGVVAVKCSACETYPYEDNTFDLITATDVLEHLRKKDIHRALSEMYRVSKGHLLLAHPFHEEEDEELKVNTDKPTWKMFFHLGMLPEEWWDNAYIEHGFEIVKSGVGVWKYGRILKKKE